MKTYALVPARKGSKGLPGKNIKELLGKPLIQWTIEAANKASGIDDIFVTSDDNKILSLCEKLSCKSIKRPAKLAADNTEMSSVIFHAIEKIKETSGDEDFILILLQPTSPLRTYSHIEQALRLFGDNVDCVISVCEIDNHICKAYIVEGEYLVALMSPSAPYQCRQLLPRTVLPNGAIYIFTASKFKEYSGIPRDKIKPFIMSKNDSIDIDSIEDFKRASMELNRRHKND